MPSKQTYRKAYYEAHKETLKARARKRYYANRATILAKHKAYQKVYLLTPNGRFLSARQTARYRGHNWSLTREQYFEITKSVCYYCGQKVLGFRGSGLDRTDSAKGYELGNIVSCCGICNQMKNSLSVAKFYDQISKITTNRIAYA